MRPCSPTTTSGTGRSRSRSSCAGTSSSDVGPFDERLGSRLGGAVGVGRGDRLPRPRAAHRRPHRVRPDARRAARRARERRAHRLPRRRKRRVPAAQARVSSAHDLPNARPADRRSARIARAARRSRRAVPARHAARAAPRLSRSEALEDLSVTLRATARARSARLHARALRPNSAAGRRGRARRRRPSPRLTGGSSRSHETGCGTPIPADVSHELDRAAARRVHDRQTAGHRLDDERRARILHLRVQEQMGAPEDRRRVTLRVLADEVDVLAQAELVEERLHGAHEPTRDEQSARRAGSLEERRASGARARAGTPASDRRREAAPDRPAGAPAPA